MKKWLSKNVFIMGIFLACFCGLQFPLGGQWVNQGDLASKIVIFLMFTITGYSLPSKWWTFGLNKMAVHLYIQAIIFLLIPIYFIFSGKTLFSQSEFLVAIVAISVLPTTISSCIVLTQLSGGNMTVSLFSSGFSNIFCVLLSPLILSAFFNTRGFDMPAEQLLNIFSDLGTLILLPVLLGQIVSKVAPIRTAALKSGLNHGSSLLIFLLTYFGFAKLAIDKDLYRDLSELLSICAYLAISHLIILLLVWYGAGLFRFDHEDKIAVLYTATQKPLGTGIPMLTIFFSSDVHLFAQALFALSFYYFWQLIIAAMLKNMSYKLAPRKLSATT